MISEPGHWRSGLAGPAKEDTTMMKTISAALLGVAILAAPTLAATLAKPTDKSTDKSTAKTTQAPAAKATAQKATAQKATAQKTTPAPVIKADQAKSKVMNANAKMHRHHVRHHRHHKMSVLNTRHTSKVAIKHIAPAKTAKSVKRG
jgi:hypothetical protein